jgi:23S rRNA pseudouridine1911/1915/1917 synthase
VQKKKKKTMEFKIEEDEPLKNALNLLRADVVGQSQHSPLQLFAPPQIFANPEDIELPIEEIEEEPIKERPTRAERYAATKIKRALKKERERLKSFMHPTVPL